MEMELSNKLTQHQNSNNLIRIDIESVRNGTIFENKFQSTITSEACCKNANAFQFDSHRLNVKVTQGTLTLSEQQDKAIPQLEEIIADSPYMKPLCSSKSKWKKPRKTDENLRSGRYCTSLFVDLEAAASSTCKTYSSSVQQFCELKHNAISTFISSFHTHVINTERTLSAKCISQHRNYDAYQGSRKGQHCIGFGIKHVSPLITICSVLPGHDDIHDLGQEIIPQMTVCSSIYRQLSFVSKLTMDISSASHPITASEMNALVRSKMSASRQSKPPKCNRSSRKTTSDVGYLQHLILQSDLVLCNPLEDDSDSESDFDLHDGYFSDFCWFDILDLDILYQIFHLLPTRDLAALKCVCQDFKWLIEFYDIGGVDSKWSESNSYRDDPCMHCGKIKDPSGDVSLCRWHPKGYYKDGHYGRHYWICCRQSHKDAPGCVVGVHDNNWTTSRERLCHIPKPKRKPSRNNYWALIQ